MSLLRSLLIATPLIALATVYFGALSLAASFFDRSGRAQHAIARAWAGALLAASGIRVRVEGLEKLDPGATYVFAANHASYMDIPVILARLPYPVRFFAKKSLFRIPFLGTHLRRAGHFAVDRSSGRASLKTMSEAARMVRQQGVSALIFPEGGRSLEGLGPFKEGAAYIAIKAGVPLAPLALKGTRERLPMGSIHIRPGQTVLRIGDPIPTAGTRISERGELNRRLYEEIARLLA